MRSLKFFLPHSIQGLCGMVAVIGAFVFSSTFQAVGQESGSLGNGLGAAAIGRGGALVSETGGPLDAVEGNPAGLAGVSSRLLDASVVGLIAGGSFQNAANSDAKLRGVAGALPYGAFAMPIGHHGWVVSVAITPEILMRANWHYVDAPGTAGVTYGYQRQETQIIAVRPSLGLARNIGSHWAAGATLGIVYNQNDLHSPYIFQQQPQLAGLKVLLDLTTRGYGWNGSAGVQWQPTDRVRAGVAWKSGTTIHTQGDASGSASALFQALGIKSDPTFTYHAQVMNHLPQAFDAGFSLRTNRHLLWSFEGDFTAWGQAFQQLPITMTQGSNATINSVVGSNAFHDAVPLHWANQGAFHGGLEVPAGEAWTVRGGYSYASNPVPSSTLIPLTAAIMQNSVATGAGWTHKKLRLDAAYQAQLPSAQSVGQSGLKAGEYNNSRVRVWTQSITVTARVKF
jgi:long-subunit fatty acid transport protein